MGKLMIHVYLWTVCLLTDANNCVHIEGFQPEWYISTMILRVSNQNGVSLLYIMLEIHHYGQEPTIYSRDLPLWSETQYVGSSVSAVLSGVGQLFLYRRHRPVADGEAGGSCLFVNSVLAYC